jgi:putative ABC transport system permease protein
MVIKSNIEEATKSLYGAKQRTILALFGIIIGIGSVIAMVSIGTIVEAESLRQFKDMGTDILSIQKGYGGGAKKTITIKDAEGIPSNCSSIATVAPYIQAGLPTWYAGKKVFGPCMGVTGSFQDLNKIEMKQGRFISDLDAFAYFCVLGDERAARLRSLGLHEPVGKKLKVGDHIFTVVGVLERLPGGGGMRPHGVNDSVLIPIKTAVRIVENAEISNIMARMMPGFHNTTAQAQITDYFSNKVRGPEVEVRSAEELIEQMEKQMKLFTLLLGAVGSISLIVGGVGVMNVMLVSVTERRKEIGIRRALGAKRKDIQSQFLVESMILSLVGGFFGICMGVSASYIIAHFSKWQFMVSYMAILLGFGVSSAVGVFFGFYPARQASRLDPIAALRSE